MGETADIWLCILSFEERKGPQLGATKAELSTSLECINAVGYATHPLMIVKGTTVGRVWLEDVKKKDIRNYSLRASILSCFLRGSRTLFLNIPAEKEDSYWSLMATPLISLFCRKHFKRAVSTIT